MNRLRNKLILIFLAATLAPLAATVWITTGLLEYTLDFSATGDLEALSRSLEQTGRELYQRKREDLKRGRPGGEIAAPKIPRRRERRLARGSQGLRRKRRAGALRHGRTARATGWTTWCATATTCGSIP